MVDGYPGLYRDVLTYLKERIKEVLTGAGATIVVRIYGPDLDVLRDQGAGGRGRRCEASQGVTNLKVEPQILVPQLDVRLRPEAAGALRPDRRATSAGPRPRCVKGTKVGEVYDEQKIFDVVVWGVAEGPRRRLRRSGALPIETPLGDARPARRRGRRRDRAGPERDQAREGVAADRRDLQRRRAATSAASPARSRRTVRRARRSSASTTPSSSASTPPGRNRSRRLLALAALSLAGHPADPPRRLPLAAADGPGRR